MTLLCCAVAAPNNSLAAEPKNENDTADFFSGLFQDFTSVEQAAPAIAEKDLSK